MTIRKLGAYLCCALVVAIVGFLSLLLGVCVAAIHSATEYKTLMFTIVGLLISMPVAFLLLGAILGKSMKSLSPLFAFFAVCGLCGLLYELVKIPEGFKLIGIAVLLLSVGLLSAKAVARRPGS